MRFRWTKSLRFQLAVWSLATTALILLAASVLCFSLVRFALVRETDQALHETAASLLRRMTPDEPAEPGDPPAAFDPAAIVRTAPPLSATLPGVGSDALCLRLARRDTGQTVAASPVLAGHKEISAALAALPAEPSGPLFAGTQDDAQVRCLTAAVPRSPYVLQVAAPWDPADDLLTELLFGLLLASLLFLLLSGIGTGLLVGRALRPIDRIVSEAEQLTPDDLDAVLLNPHALSDTEIGHLIAALNRMLSRVSGAAAAQRQFTADASHELRTPLTILRGQFELALSRPRSAAEYQSAVESGLEETLRMSRIVDSLAYLARGEAAASALHFAPVSLSELAAEATAQPGRADEKDIQLIAAVDSGVTVRGDADALRRLIRNLVENAVAYTPPGGTVTVSVSGSSENGRCHLRVADTGIGIAPKDLPFIFDRFFRADPARVQTGGSGLGLSIVQSIAEAHSGTVTAESELGRGSTFTVTLPQDQTRT